MTTTNNRYAIFILGVLFFIFGFVTWLNGTLIPFLKIACELETDVQAFFVTFAFYMAYFFLAIPSSYILKKTGYKNGMALGLVVMAVGSLVFIPAANQRSFALFLTGLFVQGTGLAILQTAVNPYVSVIGPIESAAQRISIMGICNKVAGILSPIIVGAFVLTNLNSTQDSLNSTTDAGARDAILSELTNRIIIPYIIIAVILFILAFLINRSKLPEINMDGDEKALRDSHNAKSIFSYPYLWLGVICLFLYVGVEVLAGDAIGTYGRELGIPLDETKYFTSLTLGAMLLGYLIGVFTIPKYLSQPRALAYSAILGIVLSVAIYLASGYTAIVLIALLGLANALMWPAIFPLSIDGLGKFTQLASALLIMGIAGGAIMPLVYTYLKDHNILSNHLAFFVCIFPSYLYILYYGIKGYKVGKTA